MAVHAPTVGTRVSYEDMANPQLVGTVVDVHATQWATDYLVRWDGDITDSLVAETWSDLKQHGWKLAPVVTNWANYPHENA